MLNYIVFVNRKNNLIIVDAKTDIKGCSPEVGYDTDASDWNTSNKEYMSESAIFFDADKAFKSQGIYEVKGYDNSYNTSDGFVKEYMVTQIVKISELPY